MSVLHRRLISDKKMHYESLKPKFTASLAAVTLSFSFFLRIMTRYSGVSRVFEGFSSGVVCGISYMGLEKSRVLEHSPICQDLLIMNGARSGQCLKDFVAQIYVNY